VLPHCVVEGVGVILLVAFLDMGVIPVSTGTQRRLMFPHSVIISRRLATSLGLPSFVSPLRRRVQGSGFRYRYRPCVVGFRVQG
jgi:hypothetical protein